MMIEADTGQRDNATKRMMHSFMEGIFWTVSKDGKALNRQSRHRIAAVIEEGVCAKAWDKGREDIYGSAILR